MIKIELDSGEKTLQAYETLLASGLDLHMVMDQSMSAWAIEVSPDDFIAAMEILARHNISCIEPHPNKSAR